MVAAHSFASGQTAAFHVQQFGLSFPVLLDLEKVSGGTQKQIEEHCWRAQTALVDGIMPPSTFSKRLFNAFAVGLPSYGHSQGH